MAKNEVYKDADHLVLPVVASVVSGEPVKVGTLTGVAETDRDTAGNATVALKGAYTLTAAAATYAVGDAIYGHATGGGAITARIELVDKTSTTGTQIGTSLEAKTLAAAGSLLVRLV